MFLIIKNSEYESFLKEFKKRQSTFNRILEWQKLAEEEPDEIKKFIFRWISFNGLYMAVYAMYQGPDGQEKVENEPEWKVIKFFCDKFILTDERLALRIYSEEKKDDLIKLIKLRSKYMGSYLQNLENYQKIEEKAKFMVLISYKIRCRLFHGEKNPLLEMNREVVKIADGIILPLLTFILNNDIEE